MRGASQVVMRIASGLIHTKSDDVVLKVSLFSLRSLPFDFVKTRMQKMERGPDGKYPYAGPVDCALQTFKNEARSQCLKS